MPVNVGEKTTVNWMKEAQKGYIRVATLIVLSRKPTHGYEIMKEIKDKTRGFYKPTPGGVYPILKNLENSEYIKGKWSTQKSRKIKIYKITEKGRSILKYTIIKQSEIAKNMNALAKEFAREVLNVEPEKTAMPIMPDPFAVFLQENEKTTDVERLQYQRKELKQYVNILQKKLQALDEEIEDIKSKEQKVTKE